MFRIVAIDEHGGLPDLVMEVENEVEAVALAVSMSSGEVYNMVYVIGPNGKTVYEWWL